MILRIVSNWKSVSSNLLTLLRGFLCANLWWEECCNQEWAQVNGPNFNHDILLEGASWRLFFRVSCFVCLRRRYFVRVSKPLKSIPPQNFVTSVLRYATQFDTSKRCVVRLLWPLPRTTIRSEKTIPPTKRMWQTIDTLGLQLAPIRMPKLLCCHSCQRVVTAKRCKPPPPSPCEPKLWCRIGNQTSSE